MNHWPLNRSYFWERAPFFRLLLPLVAGIFSYPTNTHSTVFFNIILFITLLFFSGYVISALLIKKQNHVVSFLCINGFLYFIAWSLCFIADIKNDNHWFGHQVSTADSFAAVLLRPPIERNKTWKLEVAVTNSITGQQAKKVKGNAYIYVYKYPAITAFHEGDTIIIPNQWETIRNRDNPFEFDYAAFTSRNGIYYQQFLSQKDLYIIHYATNDDLSWVRRIHHWSKRRLEWYINDAATLGLLEAMLIGDKTELAPEQKQIYAETGIVHTIAISGAHIGTFFLLVVALLFWIRHRKYSWVKYIAALPLVWCYVLIAGAPASAIRAATMFSVLAIGFALQKSPNGINQLLATAFIILCMDPALLYNIGFQLSFVAVLSIFIFYRQIYESIFFKQKPLRLIWSAISISIAAEILVAPLVIYYFHLFPLQFIVANLIAFLFMGMILIGGMLLIMFSIIPVIAEMIGALLIWVSTFLNLVIYQLRSYNIDYFRKLTLSFTELCWVYFIITAFALFLLQKNRRGFYLSIIALLMFISWNIYERKQTEDQKILVMYNIRNDSYTELIDGLDARLLYRKKAPTAQTQQYVLQPAHINWHISRVDTNIIPTSLIEIGGKKAYLYSKENSIPTDVDYLLLTGGDIDNDIQTLQIAYSPSIIVIGSSFPRSLKASLLKQCEQLEQPVHDIAHDGAFILRTN